MLAVRLVLAGLLAAVGMVLVNPGTSYACSCAVSQLPDHAAWADVVFTGTLTEIDLPPERRVMSSGEKVDYTFAVDAVHQGEVRATAVVTSAVSGASCGLEGLKVDRAYVVFATGDPARFEANLCGGTAPAGAGLLDDEYGGFFALVLSLLGRS